MPLCLKPLHNWVSGKGLNGYNISLNQFLTNHLELLNWLFFPSQPIYQWYWMAAEGVIQVERTVFTMCQFKEGVPVALKHGMPELGLDAGALVVRQLWFNGSACVFWTGSSLQSPSEITRISSGDCASIRFKIRGAYPLNQNCRTTSSITIDSRVVNETHGTDTTDGTNRESVTH